MLNMKDQRKCMVYFEDKGRFPKVHRWFLEDSGRFLARIPRGLEGSGRFRARIPIGGRVLEHLLWLNFHRSVCMIYFLKATCRGLKMNLCFQIPMLYLPFVSSSSDPLNCYHAQCNISYIYNFYMYNQLKIPAICFNKAASIIPELNMWKKVFWKNLLYLGCQFILRS